MVAGLIRFGVTVSHIVVVGVIVMGVVVGGGAVVGVRPYPGCFRSISLFSVEL